MLPAFRILSLVVISAVMPLRAFSIDQCCDQTNDPCCISVPCNKWLVSADLLYWRACEDGLICSDAFANIVERIGADGTTFTIVEAKEDVFKENWDLGYRLGLGYESGSGRWEAAAFWTHYYQNEKGKRREDHGSRWKLDFNVLDLTAGRDFLIGCGFNVTPYAGLRAAFIQQKLRANLFGYETTVEDGSLPTTFHTTIKQKKKQDFWGVGPEIGVQADWDLGWCISVYGGAAAAVLYGQFHINDDLLEILPAGTYMDHGKNRRRSVSQGVIDASFGFVWEKNLSSNNVISLALGWEHHRYFDFNQFGPSNDLCLDGLSFSGRLQF